MVTPTPEVVPIFATPFGVASLADAAALNPPLAALLTARATPAWRDPAAPAGAASFKSRDDLCEWPDAPVRQALKGIFAAVSAVAASINDLTAEEFGALRLEARAWFSVVGTDGCVPPSSYPNCSWVALYCVTAPEPSGTRFDSGVLRLLEWRPANSFQDASHGGLRLPYRPGHCTWRPTPGQLAVFPASLTHEIAPLRAAGVLTLIAARVRFVVSDDAWMPPW